MAVGSIPGAPRQPPPGESAMHRNPTRRFALVLAAGLCGCVPLAPGDAARGEPLPEPDVFTVIRASNSKAAVEQLRERHAEEVLHARLLEARIGELIAAEEGLAAEHRERLESLQAMRDEVRELSEQQAEVSRALEELRRRNDELEKARQAEEQRRAALEGAAGGGG